MTDKDPIEREAVPETTNHLVVHCPRCKSALNMGMSFSGDANIRLQGLQIDCSECLAVVHVSDIQISGTEATLGQLDRGEVKRKFIRLLRACESKNRLYFLLTLFDGWQESRVMEFMLEVNHLINDVILRRLNADPPEEIPAHEGLFVVQACLEAKPYHAVWRNFASLLVGRTLAPIPWNDSLKEYRVNKKRVSLSTSVIARNIAADLRTAGFGWLAAEFGHAYDGLGTLIRNAVAHATFLTPKEENGGAWLFGEFVLMDGHLTVKAHLVPDQVFQEYFRRFFIVRLASLEAIQELHDELRPQSFDFVAENQMKAGEMLSCKFEAGNIRIKYRGTPIW